MSWIHYLISKKASVIDMLKIYKMKVEIDLIMR